MEQALGIDLVLEKVFEQSDFGTLKRLRLVSKYWNQLAKRVIRKRCHFIELTEYGHFRDYHLQLDNHLPNREIIAKIPIEAVVDVGGRWDFLDDLLKNIRWRTNIEHLQLEDLSIGDANRLTLFVLQQLPALKELQLVFCHVGFEYNVPVEKFAVPVVPTGSSFPLLEAVRFEFDNQPAEQELDPTFLKRCPRLRKIAFLISPNLDQFLSFFKKWKAMYMEEKTFHRYKHVEFQTTIKDPTISNLQALRDAIIEFINMNQPTSLELSADFDYKFPKLFPRIERWNPSIKFLLTDIPVHRDTRKCRADLLFHLLKKFEVFADLREIHLRMPVKKCMPLTDVEVQGGINHQLGKVTSLKLENYDHFDTRVIKQAAFELPSLTRLTLTELNLDYEANNMHEIDFQKIFNAVKEFSGLRELCLEIEAVHSELKSRKAEINKHNDVGGYFKELSAVKGLSVFRATVKSTPVSKNTAMAALFHGYEPHVQLDLDIQPVSWDGRIRNKPGHKLQLTVGEFKAAMVDAKASLVELDDPEDEGGADEDSDFTDDDDDAV